jgi:saccharopine dehydrogenase-like NADP-dependent oxidoreductase
MKVLALGCGDMGRMAIAVLVPSPKITSITVADKNGELAKKFVELVGSEKLTSLEIDVTEQEKLVDLISKHDLVISTVGPYYKFGIPILRAVIKAKRNYVDICDDWKPTLEMLELDGEAKAADITAIIGIGASPGITNLMAVIACSELDEVDEVITGWGLGNTKSGKKPPFFVSRKKLFKESKEEKKANAALLHLLYESIGKILTFRDGKLVEIDALTEVEPLKFPGGGRAMYACHVGHPEPVTLSRTLKAKSISNVMYLTKYFTNTLRDYIEKIASKQLTEAEVAIEIERALNKWWVKLILGFWLLGRFFKLPPELCVIAKGKKDGKPIKVAVGTKYRPYGEVEEGMDGITAIPLAVAALMLIDGKITKKGVLTPEESINPDEFFERYAPYCQERLSKEDVLIKKIVDL